jgi:hypothetical protein
VTNHPMRERFQEAMARFPRIGTISHVLTPSYGSCWRCHTTWTFVSPHKTRYGEGEGCFPLCEQCWEDAGTPDVRLPYYRALWEEWAAEPLGGLPAWELIEQAVKREAEAHAHTPPQQQGESAP